MFERVEPGARAKRLLRALTVALPTTIGFAPVPFVSTPAVAQEQAQPQAGLEPLDFVTSSGAHRFSVEVMRTDAELERGLMFRRYLPPDRGMLFDFKVEQPVMMWMKNTYISLDMVFISRGGIVKSIAENAEPLSERIIPSGSPVFAVVELNAGAASRIALKPGDRVIQTLFKP